jgi:glycosyltransferase involved in cell wall biosynthesis
MSNMPNIRKSIKALDKMSNKFSGYSNKHIIIGLITLIICLYALWRLYKWYSNCNGNSNGNGNGNGNGVPNMKRPYLNMWGIRKDGTEFLVNIVFITHPFTRDECIIQYNEAKDKGVHFLGLSSYSEYPGPVSNTHDLLHDRNNDAWTKYDYFELTRGWLSCFNEENNKKWIKEGFPCVNITESDFCNYETHLPDPTVKKEYDFIYICLKDGDKKEGDKDCPSGWQSEIRQWNTVKKLLDIMCEKFKLKGLLIGRVNCSIPKQCHQLMELTDFMAYHDFIKQYNRCKFILTASFQDCSPRTCSEALCFNLPVLMNKNILGGWHFINEDTGTFYDPDNIDAFSETLDTFLKKLNNNEYHSIDWFIKNYGKYNSGKRLLNFVKKVFKEDELNFKYTEIDYLKPAI